GLVEMPQRVIVEEGTTALILPGAGHRGNAGRGMHLRSTIAAAGEAVPIAEECPLCLADRLRKGFDLRYRNAADCRRPFRRTRLQMRLELVRAIGVFVHVIAVGIAVAE